MQSESEPGDNSSEDSRPILQPLTPRQKEIVRYLAPGLTNAEIAQHLNLSYYTVRNHLTTIFQKLGATSRTHAVALLRQQTDLSI